MLSLTAVVAAVWRPRHPHMKPSLGWVWPLRAQVGPMRAHTYRLNPAARPFVESK
jgi:hypothetical protein